MAGIDKIGTRLQQAPSGQFLNEVKSGLEFDFDDGLRRTVQWYLEHREWCEAVQRNRYGRERLGFSGKQS